MSELDTLLESGFQEAANRGKNQGNSWRLCFASCSPLWGASQRGKIRANLTLRSLIEQKSPQLAVYFGLDAGVAHRQAEEREARELLKQRMTMLTERSRQANEAAAKRREYNLIHGRNPFHGGLL